MLISRTVCLKELWKVYNPKEIWRFVIIWCGSILSNVIVKGKLKIQVSLTKNNKEPDIEAYHGICYSCLGYLGNKKKMMQGMPNSIYPF